MVLTLIDNAKVGTSVLTQYGEHSVVFQDFHGTWTHKVDGLQGIALPDEELPGGTEWRLDDERQRAQAPPAGWFKQRELEQLLV